MELEPSLSLTGNYENMSNWDSDVKDIIYYLKHEYERDNLIRSIRHELPSLGQRVQAQMNQYVEQISSLERQKLASYDKYDWTLLRQFLSSTYGKTFANEIELESYIIKLLKSQNSYVASVKNQCDIIARETNLGNLTYGNFGTSVANVLSNPTPALSCSRV